MAKILIACEESQRICSEFRRLGHEAYSADIQECSGGHPEWHIMGDCMPLINGNCEFVTMDGKVHNIDGQWDLLIAHPPCTYLSNAGACRLYPHKGEIDQSRYKKGMDAKEFFMRFYNAECKRICIENPMPSSVFNLPKKTQVIQPYSFYGAMHPYSKRTYLWLKGLPNLVEVCPTKPIGPFCPSGTGRKLKDKYGSAKRGDDAKNRSKTFPGIAAAIAQQWGKLL